MNQPIHPLAASALAKCREWAVDLSVLDSRFYCFAIGSIFRPDFDPRRSDIDLMLVIDSKWTSTLGDAMDVVRAAAKATARARSYLSEDDLRFIPLSPSLYFTREIEANIHRSAEPSYYRVTQFVPLVDYAIPYDVSLASQVERGGPMHPSLSNAIGAAQQVRHQYLQSNGLASHSQKLWEKVFHQLRNLMRATGQIDHIHKVLDRELLLDLTIHQYPDTGLPVGQLYQSLKTGDGPPDLQAEVLLQAYEALGRLAWRIDGERGRVWTHTETRHFAARPLLDSLSAHGRYGSFAIDAGLALYMTPSFHPATLQDSVVIDVKRTHWQSQTLTNPSEYELSSCVLDIEDPKLRAYLQQTAKSGARGKFQSKVGVSRLDYPIARLQEPLRLQVYPVSYWVIREFNRRLLDQPDPQLGSAKDDCLSEILNSTESIAFHCPAALYVHLAVVTSDESLLVVEKNYRLSALARRGLRWSCTIEEGFVWEKDVKGDHLDLRAVSERGLKSELGVESEAIAKLSWFGIALETTHLNLGFLGVVTLSLSANDLVERVRQSEDFGSGLKLIPLEKVFDTLFVQGESLEGSWHPTSRMRALLALYSTVGREQTWRELFV